MSSENPYTPPAVEIKPQFEQQPTQPPWTLSWILFSFEGRIPRRIFWAASIGITIVFYGIIFACIAIFGEESIVTSIVTLVLYVPVLWTSLAIQAKRWHDRDKSGWWILIGFIPCIGSIWQFVENGCLRGTYGPNSYGPDPT